MPSSYPTGVRWLRQYLLGLQAAEKGPIYLMASDRIIRAVASVVEKARERARIRFVLV